MTAAERNGDEGERVGDVTGNVEKSRDEGVFNATSAKGCAEKGYDLMASKNAE